MLNKIIAVGRLNNQKTELRVLLKARLRITDGWKIDSVVDSGNGNLLVGINAQYEVEMVEGRKVSTTKRGDDNCRVVFTMTQSKGRLLAEKAHSRFGSNIYLPGNNKPSDISDFWKQISTNCDKENGGPRYCYKQYLWELIVQGDLLNEPDSVARNRVLEYLNQYCPGLWGNGRNPNLNVSFVPYGDQFFCINENKEWRLLLKLELGMNCISFYVAFDSPEEVIVDKTSLRIGKGKRMSFQNMVKVLNKSGVVTRKKS